MFFFDVVPIVIAIVTITTGPLVIGLILRLFGLRLLARVAAVLSAVLCIAFLVFVGLHDGSGWFLVVGQLLLAIGLWALSPMKAPTLTGEPADDAPPT